MSMQHAKNAGGFVSRGQFNRVLGWTMLVIGVALAAALDPWLFAAQSAIEFGDSIRPAVRHTQGVLLGMGLLQLAMAHLLATSAYDRDVRQTAALLTILGAVIYTAGYALGLMWPDCYWLVLAGSLINFSGFARLLWAQPRGDFAPQIRMLLPVVCFGMLLDFVAGLFQVVPEPFVFHFLGDASGVRLRMMRLARVAAIALSALTLLYYGVAQRVGTDRSAGRLGGFSLACGAIGMPSILVAASFSSLHWKYLLALPSAAVLVGVFLGLMFALRHARLLERWGWVLIAASTSVGMLMGLYAFDGPVGTPEFLGEANEIPRRLSRVAHGYSIVYGILAIFLARELDNNPDSRWSANLGVSLFVAGSATAVGVLIVQMIVPFSTYALGIGPAIAVIGAVVCLSNGAERRDRTRIENRQPARVTSTCLRSRPASTAPHVQAASSNTAWEAL